MHETPEDLAALQALIDRSYAAAGAHLLGIHTPERRLSAASVAERLQGMCLLALATVTADGRPVVAPVDGILHRGAFHFSATPGSLRHRHLSARPAVSATHLPGEHLAITVHGRAALLDVREPTHSALRETLLEVYEPRYGAAWAAFLDRHPVYARIDAERMFTFFMDPRSAE